MSTPRSCSSTHSCTVSSRRLHVQSVEELHRASLRRRLPVRPLSTPNDHHRPVSFLWKERRLGPPALPSELPGPPQSLPWLGGWPILFSVNSTAGKSWAPYDSLGSFHQHWPHVSQTLTLLFPRPSSSSSSFTNPDQILILLLFTGRLYFGELLIM